MFLWLVACSGRPATMPASAISYGEGEAEQTPERADVRRADTGAHGLLKAALRAHHIGKQAQALALLKKAKAKGGALAEIIKIEKRIGGPLLDASRVAVLLPMSGAHKRIGQELWRGIEVATSDNQQIRVQVYDTFGTEEGARLAVHQAYQDENLLILGTAGQLESKAAAEVAAALAIPIALLAPKSWAANGDAGVFRLALAPSFEAEQAAVVAVEMGYHLLAVMAPRDDSGREQAAAFIKTAKNLGAEVVVQGDYDPEGRSLEKDFRTFLQLSKRENKRLRKHLRTYGQKSWKSFVPIVPFDLLYMPDTAARGSLAASYLPFFNVELRAYDDMDIFSLRKKSGGLMPRVVQLMGGSSWLDPTFAVRGGAAVEGALVIGTCPGGLAFDLSASGQAFHQRFKKKNGSAPSATAAMAHDAMMFVANVVKNTIERGGTREDARKALLHGQLSDGVCGKLDMQGDGQVIGEIEVLRIEQGAAEIFEY